MQYAVLKAILGPVVVSQLEEAVYAGLARSRTEPEADQALLRLMVSLLGALICNVVDERRSREVAENCCHELLAGLEAVERLTEQRHCKLF